MVVNLALMGTIIYLGVLSANQMREIVKEDFQPAAVGVGPAHRQSPGARHQLLEAGIEYAQLLPFHSVSGAPHLANRMRATLASVRDEGVWRFLRLNAVGQRAYLLDDRGQDHIPSGPFKDAPYLKWAPTPKTRGGSM